MSSVYFCGNMAVQSFVDECCIGGRYDNISAQAVPRRWHPIGEAAVTLLKRESLEDPCSPGRNGRWKHMLAEDPVCRWRYSSEWAGLLGVDEISAGLVIVSEDVARMCPLNSVNIRVARFWRRPTYLIFIPLKYDSTAFPCPIHKRSQKLSTYAKVAILDQVKNAKTKAWTPSFKKATGFQREGPNAVLPALIHVRPNKIIRYWISGCTCEMDPPNGPPRSERLNPPPPHPRLEPSMRTAGLTSRVSTQPRRGHRVILRDSWSWPPCVSCILLPPHASISWLLF